MLTDRKDKSENPALSLFFADPKVAGFLRSHEQGLLAHRAELTSISTPSPDADGIAALRNATTMMFPGQDVVAQFRPIEVQALRDQWSAGTDNVALSSDDLVYLQLAIILLRLASDYLSAHDLFEAHMDGFIRAYPRVLAFNPITSEVAWDTVRKQMEQILEEGFRKRYDDMAKTASQHFRDTRLANEALMIGMMLIDRNEPVSESPDGLAFEGECENALRSAHFTVERTPVSGDFGIDLLARKHGLTYAIQCKSHKVPVGVSAVQEAAAGRGHYVADCAVVVASSGFTAQARRLAESNAVLLIGPAQLPVLDDLSRRLL
jgi:hypothetical protein